MEVTQKTEADKKVLFSMKYLIYTSTVRLQGGTLIQYRGKLLHLELPQVPPDHVPDFLSTTTFK
jgi:hypothetical protein